MCITKVEAWAFDGKTYEHEIDAVQHAVENMLGNAGMAKTVLGRIGELLPLLDRYATLKRQAAGPKTSKAEKVGKDPGPEAPPMSPDAVRELLVNTFRNKAREDKGKPKMQTLIRDAGFDDLTHLKEQASDLYVNALLAKVTESPVSGQVLDVQGHDKSCASRLRGYEADCRCGKLIRHRSLYALADAAHTGSLS